MLIRMLCMLHDENYFTLSFCMNDDQYVFVPRTSRALNNSCLYNITRLFTPTKPYQVSMWIKYQASRWIHGWVVLYSHECVVLTATQYNHSFLFVIIYDEIIAVSYVQPHCTIGILFIFANHETWVNRKRYPVVCSLQWRHNISNHQPPDCYTD